MVTSVRWVAERPPGSLANTVTATDPGTKPAMLRMLSDTETVASAAYGVRTKLADWPAVIVRGEMEPAG